MDVITVPKDIGGSIPLLEGVTQAELSALHMGKSQQGMPKVTIEFTILEEISSPEEESSVGAKCLETCSLQPQALWKLNDYYKQVKGEDIPQGDHSADEFLQILLDALHATKWSLDLAIEPDNKGVNKTRVQKATFIPG